MFGDFFGGASLQLINAGQVAANVPYGGAVRHVKIAENNSPIPRNRLILNYNFFNNVLGGIGDVNRYTLGANVLVNERISVRPAMVIPLSEDDEQFDYEAMVQMNVWR